MAVETKALLLVRLDLMAKRGFCPKCRWRVGTRRMRFSTYHRCHKCGYELAVDNESGRVREPHWFGWSGD